jgi:tRNA 2-selenouridine synthase
MVNRRPNTTDYRSIFLNDTPLMDVRAPMEFEKGSFPTAYSMPLMSNEERHLVGICYKESGKESAVELGHSLVSGEIKEERMEGWAKFAQQHSHDGYLYCFRGGLRSHTIQTWIGKETGIHLPLVTGGYKAMRRFLLEELNRSLDPKVTQLIRVCGPTGSSKTKLILQIPKKSIDLEGLSHHRGSSFGHFPDDQPTQINFENLLSVNLMQLIHNQAQSKDDVPGICTLFVEDEGRKVGNHFVPPVLADRMANCSGLVMIEADVEERIEAILQDYIYDLGDRYVKLYGVSVGMEKHRFHLMEALAKCQKRMSGQIYKDIKTLLSSGFDKYSADTTEIRLLQEWIKRMLLDYYDPLYKHTHAQQSEAKVLFRGNLFEAIDFCKSY